MASFLDKNGLSYFFSKIKTLFDGRYANKSELDKIIYPSNNSNSIGTLTSVHTRSDKFYESITEVAKVYLPQMQIGGEAKKVNCSGISITFKGNAYAKYTVTISADIYLPTGGTYYVLNPDGTTKFLSGGTKITTGDGSVSKQTPNSGAVTMVMPKINTSKLNTFRITRVL